MSIPVRLEHKFKPSPDIVVREFEGQVLIIPLTAAISTGGEELYTLNGIGQEVWRKLDGRRSISAVVAALCEDFSAPHSDIRADVLDLVRDLVTRRFIVDAGPEAEP